MNKKIFVGVTTLIIALSGVLCGCGQSKTDDAKESGHLSSVKSDNNFVAEIIPNDASDFKWREFTAEEAPEFQGGILITGYVGERTDVVIPKSIQDKPVVAINDYAFCPFTEKDLTYNHDGDDNLDPEEKLFELAGAEDYDTWHEKYSDYTSADRDPKYYDYRNDLLNKYLEGHESVSNIQSIMIPNTVEVIGELAFGFCDSLETVEIYGADEKKTPSIMCIYMPFYNNSKLKSFNFYLVSEKGYGNNYYFEYCTSLEDVYLYPTDEGYVDLNWLESSENINSIHIADSTTSISGISSNYGEYDTYDPILTYGDYSNIIFEKNVSEIYLPSSLTDISNHTFCTHISTELSKLRSSEIEEMECPDHASVIVIAPEGSYAERYANDNGISCVNSKEEITKKMKETQQANHQTQYEEALARMEIKKGELALYDKKKDIESLQKSANNVLVDLETAGNDVGGTYIISSIEDKNYQCNADVLSSFNESINEYFSRIADYNYFIVCDNGLCAYVVVSDRNNSKLLGTYPENSLYKKNSGFESIDLSSYSYEKLYQLCLEEVSSYVKESESLGNTATIKADGGLNMRKDAGTEYDKITLIPDGSTVEIIEEKGEWSKVKYENYIGWVKSLYLR